MPTRRAIFSAGLAGALLSGCSGIGLSPADLLGGAPKPSEAPPPPAAESGQIRIGLILPLSAGGNAGAAGQSMRNAAEMALAEFNHPAVQLIVKDDGGTAQGAQQAAQQAVEEGAEIILGPLFAHSVGATAQVARARGVPVIAFSTDSNVAARGVYLLSFLPESDVERIVDYAVSQGKRSFLGLLPDNAYGSVVEAALKQTVARKGGRVTALERYPADAARQQQAVKLIAQAAGRADVLFIPDGAETVVALAQMLGANGVDVSRLQIIGTGLWDDPRMFASPAMEGGWFAAPDSAGFRAFAARYRGRYGQEPVRTASLAYDAAALVTALAKTQGAQRFSEETLTNASGFAGIDGVFRFRSDGLNQRGLAVLKVTPNGAEVIAPAARSFSSSAT